MARSAIVALGILKANWERDQKDYLENLVPIVVEALRTMADDAVSLPQLRGLIAQRFGLDIPLNPLKGSHAGHRDVPVRSRPNRAEIPEHDKFLRQ